MEEASRLLGSDPPLSPRIFARRFPAGKRLKRFAKIYLEPGQSRTLTFRLRSDDLSFIGADNKSVVEPGVFEVSIAGLKDRFELK